MSEALEPLERKTLALLIAGHADEETLRAQLAATTVVRRRNAGHGMYVGLHVAAAAPSSVLVSAAAVTGAKMVECTIGGIHGSALLWLDGGRLHELEIAVFDGTTMPWMRIDRVWTVDDG